LRFALGHRAGDVVAGQRHAGVVGIEGHRTIDQTPPGRWPTLILVHLPIHASWLNQVEIYHSIIQRTLLATNDFNSTAELARALNDFERHYNEIAKAFVWNYFRRGALRTRTWSGSFSARTRSVWRR